MSRRFDRPDFLDLESHSGCRASGLDGPYFPPTEITPLIVVLHKLEVGVAELGAGVVDDGAAGRVGGGGGNRAGGALPGDTSCRFEGLPIGSRRVRYIVTGHESYPSRRKL